MSCLLCNGSTDIVVDLGRTALANNLQKTKDAALNAQLYPLQLVECNECNHLQLNDTVDEKLLYTDYNYRTANTEYLQAFADDIVLRFNPRFVVDIGSNDGKFGSLFNKKHKPPITVRGVDPSSQADTAIIPTMKAFFNKDVSQMLLSEFGKADIITCLNCFAHNADLSPILGGVDKLLADDGTFIIEVHYGLRMLEQANFSLIYQEHMHHWTARSLDRYLNKFGFLIVDIQEQPVHGGSIRCFIRRKGRGQFVSSALTLLKAEEVKLQRKLCLGFHTKIAAKSNELWNKIGALKTPLDKEPIIGLLCYPAKAATLCSVYDLDADTVKFVFDDNENKIGKFSHEGVKILSTAAIQNKRTDALIIMAWNYKDELKNRFKDYKGVFIDVV